MFESLKSGDEIKKVLKEAFDMELPVSGEWGYEKSHPLVIQKSDMPYSQVEFIFATMRATLEMSLTQPVENRYGGINLKELSKESIDGLEKVVFEISAIKEDLYKELIKEYKEGYGKSDFDMKSHFQKREDQTIKRTEEFWFKLN